LLKAIGRKEYSLSSWKQHLLNPKEANKFAIDWIFVVDCLNFSFWSDDKFQLTYKGNTFTGYWSLCAAINRAIDENIPIVDPSYFSTLNIDQLKYILRGDNENREMPLLEERLKILHEAGSVLMNKFNGSFMNCIALAENKCENLLTLIVDNFSSFRDEALFLSRKVSFYKRAQILIADIWACFEGKGIGYFEDIDTLTMFADYRVPQVLAYFGVLEYSAALMKRLQRNEMMISGESDEVEIRGASILAINLICSEIKRIYKECGESNAFINDIIADFYLWDYRREFSEEIDKIPFHKVRSIYY
ncbi:UPF0553 protein C9orf64-like isoform X2, partial [Dinothrombium tinctorium]